MSKPVDRFSENMYSFIELSRELITKCYQEGKTKIHLMVITMVEAFLKDYDREKLIFNFITTSCEYWDEIHKRNEIFFSQHCGKVMKDLPTDYVDSFKVLFESKNSDGTNVIGNEDREAIWDYFDCLIKTSLHHIHYMRKPVIKNGQKSYLNHYHTEVKIAAWAKTYNVKFDWNL